MLAFSQRAGSLSGPEEYLGNIMTAECCDRMDYDLSQKCEVHNSRYDCPDALIEKHKSSYGIIVHDGGSSSIEINFCPWCGASLLPK